MILSVIHCNINIQIYPTRVTPRLSLPPPRLAFSWWHIAFTAVLKICIQHSRGATTFSKLGVQFLGLGYYTEQNTDGIPSFVHCSLQLRKKLGWSVQILGGPDPPTSPVVAPLQHSNPAVLCSRRRWMIAGWMKAINRLGLYKASS